ncbi:hypothetical protein H9Q73_013708 [Fusarium xylarioides]|nr:hypothetical protein H9Q73_013708 [Fusarium xylarioides]
MSDDVITDDFDVEVFLHLLHWSWEDACNGTHEPERPVSPFSQPLRPISEIGVPPTDSTVSRYEWDSSEERRLSLDSQVYSSSEDLGPLDRDEGFSFIRSAAPSPAPCSFSSGRSPQSTNNYDLSPRAQTPNLKRSCSSDNDGTAPKRICRQISSIADRLGDKQPDGCCYDDFIERRKDSATPEANVSWANYH